MNQVITANFNGAPCNAEFSLVLGASSGTGTIEFSDTTIRLPHKGTLVFSDGTSSVELRNMYVDKPRIERDAIGGARLSATIYDKRYAWSWGYIVGLYNQSDYANIPTEEVSLTNLIYRCLTALKEANPVLLNIPDVYPSVKWEPENPATALEDLCDDHGLVIGLDASQGHMPVVICPYDKERTLPSYLNTSVIEGVSSAIKPSKVVFFGGRSVIQREFSYLVPVGEEANGEIKRIDDLSYAPADWGDSLRKMFTDLSTEEERELADKCIFKWYAIDWDSYDPERVLPLLTEIIDIIKEEGITKRDKPYVLGEKTRWDGVSFITAGEEKISEGFSIDKNLGLVKFNELVVIPKSDGYAAGGFTKGIVHLVAAYHLKNNNINDFYTKELAIPGGTELPVYYEDSKVVLMYKVVDNIYIVQNLTEILPHVDKVLDSVKKYFISRYPKIYTYPGIFRVGVWGAIRNVVWRADAISGGFTEIHKDLEIPKPMLPDYDDRVVRRKFALLWRTRKDTKDVRKVWPFE